VIEKAHATPTRMRIVDAVHSRGRLGRSDPVRRPSRTSRSSVAGLLQPLLPRISRQVSRNKRLRPLPPPGHATRGSMPQSRIETVNLGRLGRPRSCEPRSTPNRARGACGCPSTATVLQVLSSRIYARFLRKNRCAAVCHALRPGRAQAGVSAGSTALRRAALSCRATSAVASAPCASGGSRSCLLRETQLRILRCIGVPRGQLESLTE
jgi:hypothetical protein